MKTRTSPWDYARPLPPASLTVRERERAILGWVGELDGYWKRGLVTMEEYRRLINEGPREGRRDNYDDLYNAAQRHLNAHPAGG